MKRTKIIATLGPATSTPEAIDKLVQAGIDVVRLNFSHGEAEKHLEMAEVVRDRARASGRQVGVMVDLQGPKIRIGHFIDGKITLKEGDEFSIDHNYDAEQGNQEIVGCTYASLHQDLKRGDTMLLDDGRIEIWVKDVVDTRVTGVVRTGGVLSNNKGINVKGGGLSAAALTSKDKADIKTAAAMKADYLAVSFVRHKDDVELARFLIGEAGWPHCGIVSKLERAEAVHGENLEGIVEASDVVMVARGDLGVEIGDSYLPPTQKKIIKMARSKDRVTIIATQMMESMIENPIPTRAEVFDVANAVLDGTDAVMLSAETAIGKYPAETVMAMARVCAQSEKERLVMVSEHRLNSEFARIDEAIAFATMYTANHLKVKAIACLTESGATTLWMSRISSGIPIFAMTPNLYTRRRVTMYRGVYPVSFNKGEEDYQLVNENIINDLLRRGTVRDGDYVIITKGDFKGLSGGTNMMKIIKVGEHVVN
jgi:pyruvate kinase